MKAVVIAGAASGVGKTTVAAAIMGALRARGYKVQPFKVGPDYIDLARLRPGDLGDHPLLIRPGALIV